MAREEQERLHHRSHDMAMTNRVRGAFVNRSGSFYPPIIYHPSSTSNGITSRSDTVSNVNRVVTSAITDDAEEKEEDAEAKRVTSVQLLSSFF